MQDAYGGEAVAGLVVPGAKREVPEPPQPRDTGERDERQDGKELAERQIERTQPSGAAAALLLIIGGISVVIRRRRA